MSEEKKRYYSNPGSPIRVVYGSRIDKHGNIIVEPKEKQNFYQYIQSFADSTDINLLVKKFEAGDVSALSKREGAFLDLTEMPESYFEMVNKINDAKQEFYALPTEIKQKFDNDENKFIATIGTAEWYKKLAGTDKVDIVKEDVQKIVQEEKKGETVNE